MEGKPRGSSLPTEKSPPSVFPILANLITTILEIFLKCSLSFLKIERGIKQVSNAGRVTDKCWMSVYTAAKRGLLYGNEMKTANQPKISHAGG